MDTKKIKQYFVTLLIVLAIDFTWILVIAKSFYNEELSGFVRPEIVPIWSALLAWALIPLGIVLFVNQVSKNKKQSIIYGAFFGFILYGVYDFTNYATLANFTLKMLVVDVLWGIFICSISSLLLRIIGEKWLK
ncbi:DUF2177 family protein [Candidatus Woesearchaeota archaeon]|jgi:uncharacterized membrane protein|nr:DUF2177 family protein [Candidatus Woesearchaeota archaeon]MBT5272323.1 DUF2177 family protein [Candidatus Woesearchaeota archaeon]MBT6040652.1 DUF2177 family protein [Candidatus Woesearchaeota archaeon]MBT6336595.1 DUF2177 family protein [Candidatus Woesearchaeota archaeon]MBT7927485.1 DUF2177 family protein [Candidatus Woesearchaeota archaeon]